MHQTAAQLAAARVGRYSPQSLAGLVSLTFLVVGIVAFVPEVTQDYTALEWWMNGSQAQLADLFQVSILHNLLHLGFGAAGLVLARRAVTARLYLLGGGVAYLGLWVYRLAIDQSSDANFIPIDEAGNWLHFGVGLGMLGLAYLAARAQPGDAT